MLPEFPIPDHIHAARLASAFRQRVRARVRRLVKAGLTPEQALARLDLADLALQTLETRRGA